MSQLRTNLEQYVADINEILRTCQDDQAIRAEAVRRWLPNDPRFLVFTEQLPARMPVPPPNSVTGETNSLPNEMPASSPSYFTETENPENTKSAKKPEKLVKKP